MKSDSKNRGTILKKALVITYSPLDFDSRVRRQVEALADDFHVTVCHPEKSQRYPWEQVSLHWKAAVRESTGKEPGLVLRVWATISFLVRNVLLVLGLYGIAEKVPYTPYFVGYQSLRKTVPEKYELVVANDAETLPLAFALARGAAVVADLHEFAPGETAGKTLRHRTRNRQMAWICRKHLPNCSAVTVVSQAVSDLYFDHFQIPCSVLPSMPEFARIKPSAINPSNIKLVHHGIYSPNRGIELLIRAVAQLPPHFSLHLVLGGAPVVDLLNLGRSLGLQSGRLKLHDFVEPDALIVFLNQFDVEVVFVPPFAPQSCRSF